MADILDDIGPNNLLIGGLVVTVVSISAMLIILYQVGIFFLVASGRAFEMKCPHTFCPRMRSPVVMKLFPAARQLTGIALAHRMVCGKRRKGANPAPFRL